MTIEIKGPITIVPADDDPPDEPSDEDRWAVLLFVLALLAIGLYLGVA